MPPSAAPRLIRLGAFGPSQLYDRSCVDAAWIPDGFNDAFSARAACHKPRLAAEGKLKLEGVLHNNKMLTLAAAAAAVKIPGGK